MVRIAIDDGSGLTFNRDGTVHRGNAGHGNRSAGKDVDGAVRIFNQRKDAHGKGAVNGQGDIARVSSIDNAPVRERQITLNDQLNIARAANREITLRGKRQI